LPIPVRILLLLACGPLLQPPGFCVCKAVPAARAPSEHEGRDGSDFEPKVGASKPVCCSHRHGGEDRPIPVPHPPVEQGSDDDHMPGCPASPGIDSSKWAEPTPSVTAALTRPVGGVAILSDEAVYSPNPSFKPAVRWPSSPPLYLSHCSLVI
jgi:hypothetical protein